MAYTGFGLFGLLGSLGVRPGVRWVKAIPRGGDSWHLDLCLDQPRLASLCVANHAYGATHGTSGSIYAQSRHLFRSFFNVRGFVCVAASLLTPCAAHRKYYPAGLEYV